MRALITGGAGFAGSHLADHLLRQGQEVIVLAHPEGSLHNLQHALADIRVERCDILDAGEVSKVLRDAKPQRIYHLAAASSPAESVRNPRRAYEVNFTGTLNIFDAWRALQFESRLLYVSSSQVYGALGEDCLPAREDMPMRPATPYAGSKAAAELLALQFFAGYGFPIVRARPFNHTGPRQDSTFVCSSFARQVAEIELGLRAPKVQVGNLGARRDFSDVRDVVRGYHLLVEGGEPGEVYQLCSGRAVSVRSILDRLLASSSRRVELVVEASRLHAGEASAMWGDPGKSARAVGWKSEYTLDETLRGLKSYWDVILRSYPDVR